MEEQQIETASEEKGGRGYWGFVIWPVVAVMVYMLSEGPAALGVGRHIISLSALSVYKPIHAVMHIARLERPYSRYLQQWCPNIALDDGELRLWEIDI